MPPLKHVPGTRFGRLVILARDGTRISCRCDCGAETVVSLANLTTGHTVSCGCLRIETTVRRSLKHGASRRGRKTAAYRIWVGMRKRCENARCKSWPDYGGRGIRVCARWESFQAFLADMGEPPPGMSIERMDNDGDYEPGNCRWATRREQHENTRRTRLLSHGGRTQTLASWAREIGVSHSTILTRLRRGWPLDRALGKGGRHGGSARL